MTGPHEPFVAGPNAVHLHEAARLPRDFEIVFVAMKAYDTAWATQLALRHAGARRRRRVRAELLARSRSWPASPARDRSVGLVMSKIGVALWKPGEVERGMEKGQGAGHDVFRVGEHDGRITPRAQELAEMLSVIDGARATDNLWGERWAKLSQNAMGNPRAGHVRPRLARDRLQRGRPRASRSASRRSPRASGSRSGYRVPEVRRRRPPSAGPTPIDARRGRRSTGCSHRPPRPPATGAPRWPRTSPRAGGRRSTR